MAYDKLAKYATTAVERDGEVSVHYHSTEIVRATKDTVTLDTGGKRGNWGNGDRGPEHGSVTTFKKMNQAARQFYLPYSVFQKRKRIYVTTDAATYLWAPTERTFVFDRATGKVVFEVKK